jgi:hypothetical protein
MYFRYCTQKDEELVKDTEGKYEAYEEAYKGLIPHLFDTFNVHKEWEKVVMQI